MSKVSYIKERLKKIKRMQTDFIEQDLNIFQKVINLLDLSLSVIIYGAGINDYFQYQFYKRKHIDRKTFIVHRKRMRIVNTFNDPEDRKILDSKSKFNEKYNKYIQRDWLDITQANYSEFIDFTNRNNKFIIKPIDGSHGKGIRIIEVTKEVNLEDIFNELKKETTIIEELIIQHDEIAEFNPTSVNTLRVVTLVCPDDIVRIMTANLRVGNGVRYADNFHHNGIASLLNVECGTVISSGIDMNYNRYIIHPASGKQLIGFKVPYWDEVVETVKQAAKVIPTVGYVGWDVAIGKNGEIIILEGNAAADPDISQMPDQVGKWPIYESFVLEKRS